MKMDPYMEGYFDGHDMNCPEPGPNRDPRYIHSFRVARAEKAGRPIPAQVSRARAAELDVMLSDA